MVMILMIIILTKKKNFHKSNEHFEKEKKPVSEYFNIFYNN